MKEELLKQKPAQNLLQRQKRLRRFLKEKGLSGFLVSSPVNRCYLTGWFGDTEAGSLLITQQKSFVITDSRYSEHVAKEISGFEIVETEKGLGLTLQDIAERENLTKVGFESHNLSVFSLKRIKKFAKEVKLVPIAHLVEELRAVKDEEEIGSIKKAVELADKAFEHLLRFIKPGQSEKEIAWSLEKFLREFGAEGLAWSPVVVAAGKNSSMAHWGASETKIKKSDLVLVDFGCVWRGYNSDVCRVIFVGKPTDEQKKIYKLVLEAQKFGISLVEDGRLGATIDKKVRSFLEERLPTGVGSKHIYRHALGHGVGLEIHELPYVNVRRKYRLTAGNVLTIEPAIYIPGWGGVRIEDLVFITKEGCQILTQAPKEIKDVTI